MEPQKNYPNGVSFGSELAANIKGSTVFGVANCGMAASDPNNRHNKTFLPEFKSGNLKTATNTGKAAGIVTDYLDYRIINPSKMARNYLDRK